LESTPSFWAIDTGCEDIHVKDEKCVFAEAMQQISAVIEHHTYLEHLERSSNIWAWRLPDFWLSNSDFPRSDAFEARASGRLTGHLRGVDVAFLPWKPPSDLKDMDGLFRMVVNKGGRMIIGTLNGSGSRFIIHAISVGPFWL
jgi:hypothetical protein